jgi:pentatricopeptide repeat protein
VHDFHITPTEGVCVAVLHTAARHGLPALANEAVQQLVKLQIPLEEHHLAPVLEAFASQGDLKAAFSTLATMRSIGVVPTLGTTASIQKRISKDVDSVDKAWTLIEEIHAEGSPVDIVAYNTVLRAARHLKDLQRCVGIYKAAKDMDVTPDVMTYNDLFSTCMTVKHRELGDKLLEEMKAAGIKPNEETYYTFIMLCLTQSNYEDAFIYLEEMKGAGFKPARGVYEGIIRKCVRSKDTRYNLAVEEMIECGYPLSKELSDFIASGGKRPVAPQSVASTAAKPVDAEGEIPPSVEEKASQFLADIDEGDISTQTRAPAIS